MARDSPCLSVSAAARWLSGEQASLLVISLRRWGGTKPLGFGFGDILWALPEEFCVCGASRVVGEGQEAIEVQRIVCRRPQNRGTMGISIPLMMCPGREVELEDDNDIAT